MEEGVRLDSNDFGLFVLVQAMWTVSATNVLPFEHQLTSLETCGITSYGNGWRQDVMNQCLEFMNSKYFIVLRPPDQEERGKGN